MCTNFTDLNKACPKDAYPLPSINRLVDGAFGHNMLSFVEIMTIVAILRPLEIVQMLQYYLETIGDPFY